MVEEGVEEFVTLHPAGTREDALQLLARATVLLNLRSCFKSARV